MDNESYRLQHSTLAAQRKIKSCERKRKDKEGIEDDEPFELHRDTVQQACMRWAR